MLDKNKIREIKADDIIELKMVISANELFPADMLDEMMSSYFNGENNNELWLTYEEEKAITKSGVQSAIAIAYIAPEKMTEGTSNLYLIAIHPDFQGKGIGSLMLEYIEEKLREKGDRILLVETSGLDSFKQTRNFYRKCGYEEEARIREFYQAGEDKIIFRKSLIDSRIAR